MKNCAFKKLLLGLQFKMTMKLLNSVTSITSFF